MGNQLERLRIFLDGLRCLQLIESARVVVISRSSWPLERFCIQKIITFYVWLHIIKFGTVGKPCYALSKLLPNPEKRQESQVTKSICEIRPREDQGKLGYSLITTGPRLL